MHADNSSNDAPVEASSYASVAAKDCEKWAYGQDTKVSDLGGTMIYPKYYSATIRLQDHQLFLGHQNCNVNYWRTKLHGVTNYKVIPNTDGKTANVLLTIRKHGAWRHKDEVLSLIEGFNADLRAGLTASVWLDAPLQDQEDTAAREAAEAGRSKAFGNQSGGRGRGQSQLVNSPGSHGRGTPTALPQTPSAGPSTTPAAFSVVARNEAAITAVIPKSPKALGRSLYVPRSTVNWATEGDDDKDDRVDSAISQSLPPQSELSEEPTAPPFVPSSIEHIPLQDDAVLEQSATMQDAPESEESGPVDKGKRKQTKEDVQKELDEEIALGEAAFERLQLDDIISDFSDDED
jgi:hypothetical protein